MSTTIRVSEDTRRRIAAIATASDKPMTVVVDEAVDALERRRFFATVNDRYRELRADPVAWAEIEEERAREAGTLGDDLP